MIACSDSVPISRADVEMTKRLDQGGEVLHWVLGQDAEPRARVSGGQVAEVPRGGFEPPTP